MISMEFDVRISSRQRVIFTGFTQKCCHLDNKKVRVQSPNQIAVVNPMPIGDFLTRRRQHI